ncbi:MAG: FGGY family carbohydrate kinase [Planctomycetota bacterium]|jgi:L-fuculokinase|nr:FGGY family carbohydrate kinase [Planctomycetota bacterium]
MSTLVAVIDIGKTNKKVAVYDDKLRQVAYRQQEFAAAPGADGVLHEPVAAMWDWFKQTLSALFKEQPFSAIAVSTHGAAVACLDCDGELSLPVIGYDHSLSDAQQAALDADFYAACGDEKALQRETGTCDLPLLINPSKMLQFAKGAYPEGFARTVRLLNYPQYWGFKLTERQATEPTFSFNHTHLYNVATRAPSSCAEALGVDSMLLRQFKRPWDKLGTLTGALQFELGLPPLPVAVGIHDSNSALLPYLIKHAGSDFVVNSTGTWCVAMHGVDAPVYADDELGRKIIFNIDATGNYQKVSFLMGGQEYARYHELIGGSHVTFDAERMNAALATLDDRILPGAFPSQFPSQSGGATSVDARYSLAQLDAGERPVWFADQERAHFLLNASLAIQTKVALEATGVSDQTAIYVEGGFRQNSSYLAVLAALFPNQTVACTSLEQATCVGAAVLGQSLAAGCKPQAFAGRLHIEQHAVETPRLPNLPAYAEAFLAAVR